MSHVITTLTGIDAQGLAQLTDNAEADPSVGKKTLKAVTICEGGFRNLTQVRTLAPVLVSEPCHLLGDGAAPNPSEVALAALGSCISVGLLVNATAQGVTLSKIEVSMEGDIDISAVWGVGDTAETKVPGSRGRLHPRAIPLRVTASLGAGLTRAVIGQTPSGSRCCWPTSGGRA
ncbi:OsmC family protein [Streptomyces sp. NBC_01589]|uniref:OsmC family protein n=1 Tax=Streptomyces sp. NBC_01589 TaxID=2975886 RepID=UPI0038632D3D